jgi:TolB-like protein/DNA-binding SARP family transcriptional activator
MHDGPAVRVYCLGHFRIEDGSGNSLARHGQRKSLALLKTLIALGSRNVAQDELLDALWPDSDGDAAQTAFASTLYRLRQFIGQNALILHNRQLSLDPPHVWCDVNELELTVNKILSNPGSTLSTAPDSGNLLITLYRGPFLSGESEPPAILPMRERLHSRFLRAVRQTSAAMQESGDSNAAISLLESAAEIDPTAEEICQGLMTALSSVGRQAEATAAYKRLCRALGTQPSVAPSTGTEPVRMQVDRASAGMNFPGLGADGVHSRQADERHPTTGPAETTERRTVHERGSSPVKHWRSAIGTVGIFASGAILLAVILGMAIWNLDDVGMPSVLRANSGNFPSIPDGPSIAVLPFSNMSGDPEQDYFADGLTDTLITDLSKLRRILVIARHSAFTYKGRAVDLREVGRTLGVRHILEGSVQTTGDRLRINVQLIEAASGAHLWADRFDRPIEDIFRVQDEIIDRIVEELDVTLVTGEQARSWRRLTRNPVAYSEVLAGRALQAKEHTIDATLKSRDHYKRAIELDPEFALPWAYMVSVYTHLVDAGYDAEPEVSYQAALRYADRAVELNPELAIARAYRGVALQQLARYDEAAKEYALAVQNGPNAADSLMLSAWGLAAVGDAAAALPLAMRALRLDPMPPGWYWGGLADTYLRLQRWEEAIPVFERCLAESLSLVWCKAGLTVSYVRTGRMDDAKRSAREWQQIDPGVRAQDNFYLLAWSDPEFRKILSRSLAEAGM